MSINGGNLEISIASWHGKPSEFLLNNNSVSLSIVVI